MNQRSSARSRGAFPRRWFVVPKGVKHKPHGEEGVRLLLIEPRGVLNTGHGSLRMAKRPGWR